MGINEIIIYIMVISMGVAAVDRCLGSPINLGPHLDKGVQAFGPLVIPMVGMMEFAPMFARLLSPIIAPLYGLVGADPSMFANSIIACDMGGYTLGYAICKSEEAAQFAGCILGTMLGSIITFMIPVGITFVKKEYHKYYATGLMIGIITIPFGMFAGGLVAGYDISMICQNLIPVIIFALIVALGLWRARDVCMKIFNVLGFIIIAVSTMGFALGIVQELTPMVIIDDLPSILDGIKIVGGICLVLCGAFPFVELLKRFFGGTFSRLGKALGVDNEAVTGMVACLANVMPLLATCNNMSPAGVVVSMAFMVGANSVFGDFLGFVAGVDNSMIFPMLVSNFVSGLIALPIARYICRTLNIPSYTEAKRKYKIKNVRSENA